MVSAGVRRWARNASLAATILAGPLGGSDQGVRGPDVAAWTGDPPHYVLVYRSAIEGRKDRYEIRSRMVSSGGQPLGRSARLLDPGPGGQALEPRLALSPVDGTFEVAYVARRRRTSTRPGVWAIRALKLDSRGRRAGEPVTLKRSKHRLSNPRIVWGRSSNAHFGVVWRETRRNLIQGRLLHHQGTARGRVVTVVKSRAGVSAPAITGHSAGWFGVAWTHPGWSRQAIYLREFRASGVRPIRRTPGIDPHQLFANPRKHVVAHADEPVLGFDYQRREDRLAWNIQAFSGRQDAGAIPAVPLDPTSHERLGKPVLLEHDPPRAGAAYELRMFRRVSAPATDVVWWHIDDGAGSCFDFDIQHRLVTVPWRAVGERPQTLSSPEDPPGPGEDGCAPRADHPAAAGTDTEAPNTLYAWESPPYIVGVVR